MCVCVCVCVRACVRACVRVCVCVCMSGYSIISKNEAHEHYVNKPILSLAQSHLQIFKERKKKKQTNKQINKKQK